MAGNKAFLCYFINEEGEVGYESVGFGFGPSEDTAKGMAQYHALSLVLQHAQGVKLCPCEDCLGKALSFLEALVDAGNTCHFHETQALADEFTARANKRMN